VLLSTAQLKAFLFLGAVATGIWAAALIQAKTPKAPEAQPRKSAEAIQRPVGAQE
jgi:hypothetical protein